MGGLPASLIRTESGGNFRARNNVPGAGGRGHFGRGQFSRARLQDAMNAGVIPQGTTPEQFMANPAMQERVERWHTQDIMNRAERAGLTRHIGQQIGGTTVTPEGMLAVAHLGGFGGLQRFLSSGGQYNPSDAFGTSLADYLRTHGEAAGGQNMLALGQPPSAEDARQNALAAAQEADAIRQRNALAMLDRAQVQPLEAQQMEAPVARTPQFEYRQAQAAPFEFRPRSVRRA